MVSGGAGDDGRGLGDGGTGWWVRYRFPWVCKELWKDLPDSLQFLISFLNFNIISLQCVSGHPGMEKQ